MHTIAVTSTCGSGVGGLFGMRGAISDAVVRGRRHVGCRKTYDGTWPLIVKSGMMEILLLQRRWGLYARSSAQTCIFGMLLHTG